MKKWLIVLLIVSLLGNIGLGIWVWQLQKTVKSDASLMTDLLMEIPSYDETEVVQ
jgi:hypothetical protein